ncbi:MAG: hypothetical protein [Bacteriophage sp.]|nr:MAG: hypothetical protein [Bacteriophage sp.]
MLAEDIVIPYFVSANILLTILLFAAGHVINLDVWLPTFSPRADTIFALFEAILQSDI